MSDGTVQERGKEEAEAEEGQLHDDAPSTLEPPVLLELLYPVHDKAQTKAGRADGQEFCLFVFVNRDDLVCVPIGEQRERKRKGRKDGRRQRRK
jgi:hypothetical protein